MPKTHRGQSLIVRQVRSKGLDRNAERHSGCGAGCLGCDRRMREDVPALKLDYGRSFSFWRGRCAISYSYGNNGLVVESFDSGRVFGYSFEEGNNYTIRGTARTLGDG